jgi:hypothetical protein
MADYQERFYDDSLNSLTLLDYDNTITINLEMATSTSSDYSSASKNINKLNEIKISKDKVEILEHIKRFINESDVCCVLTLYYTLECIELKDWNNLKHILSILKYPDNNNINFEKWFLSQFISNLCENIDYLRIDWIHKMIFNDFLIKNLKADGFDLVYKFIDKLYNIIPHDFYSYLINCDELKPKKIVSTLDIHSFNLFINLSLSSIQI